jgi:protein-disulfide isomerase
MKDVISQALNDYPAKVQFVYKHFNRGGIDILLGNAAECAGEEGKFWEMHDYIFDNLSELDLETLAEDFTNKAVELGIDSESYITCMQEERYTDKIESHTNEGYSFAVSGTPALFVNDIFIGGAVPYERLKEAIDQF